MKKVLKAVFITAFVTVAGYSVYVNQQRVTTMTDTMLANVEALAEQELPSEERCTASMEKECCVCGTNHYTYARPTIGNNGCEHRKGCSHYNW